MHISKARLDIEASRAIPRFRQVAEASELPTLEAPGMLRITLPRATLTLRAEAGGTGIEVDSPDEIGLQLVRDMLAERISAQGLTVHWQGVRSGLQPGNQARAQVRAVQRISPSYSRVEIEGPELARFAEGPLHFRLLFGPAGEGWPTTDANGVTHWPGGIESWHRPVYTTRKIALAGDRTRLVFDVFRHDGGRVTDWTDRVVPGTEVAMTGPGGGKMPVPARWMAFVGDETAVPVIARMLAEMPADTRGEAILFFPEAGDIQQIAHPEGVRLRWVLRDTGSSPLEALRELCLPEADRFVFFASEKSEALAAREWLASQGLARGEFSAASYWTRD